MLNLEPNKIFFIVAYGRPGEVLVQGDCLGSKVDSFVRDVKRNYPDFKRIVIFDADTKEAVGMIKPD